MKSRIKVLLVFVFMIIIICLLIDIVRYTKEDNLPNDSIAISISDEFNHDVHIYHDAINNRNWIYKVINNQEVLLVYIGYVKADIKYSVLTEDELLISYIYNDYIRTPREELDFVIDIDKNETHGVSLLRRIILKLKKYD